MPSASFLKKQNYITGADKQVSFSWEDIESGAGYVSYYLCDSYVPSSSSYLYHLMSNKRYGATNSFYATKKNGASSKIIDIDFDITLNTSRTINGDIFLTIPWRIGFVNDNSGGDGYFVFNLKKVSVGGTETSLGSITTETISTSEGGSVDYNYTYEFGVYKISIANQKIASGEKIRLTVEGWASHGTYGNTRLEFAFAPYNDTITGFTTTNGIYTTTSTLDIPYKINS